MTSYAIANDDQKPSSQKEKSQSDRNGASQADAVDQHSHRKILSQVDNNQSEDEGKKQDSNQIVDNKDRLNFLALMKTKGINQIAKSIAENCDLSRKIMGNTFVKQGQDNKKTSDARLILGDTGYLVSCFLGSSDLKSLRSIKKELEQENKETRRDQNENNPDQDDNKENNEPSSGGGFRK